MIHTTDKAIAFWRDVKFTGTSEVYCKRYTQNDGIYTVFDARDENDVRGRGPKAKDVDCPVCRKALMVAGAPIE